MLEVVSRSIPAGTHILLEVLRTGINPEFQNDYPTTSGAFDTTYNGADDVFVTKLNPTGTSLVYSTFIGGSDIDRSSDIAIDYSGNTYVTGYCFEGTTGYPTTFGAYDTTHNGGADVFVTKLNPVGSSLVYSTFIGGADIDMGSDIAIDTTGNVYITGFTSDTVIDYPTTSGAYDTTHNGGLTDVFVTKLNPTGTSLVYSTFIGGSDIDVGHSITIDLSGDAYITGETVDGTNDYPTTSGAFDMTHNGVRDVFLTRLNPAGSSLVYSTFIGGSDHEYGNSIAIDPRGYAIINGFTYDGTTDYPTTSGAFDMAHNGGTDVFVTSLATEDMSPPEFGSDNSTFPATTGDQFTFAIEVTDNIEVSSVFVEFWFGTWNTYEYNHDGARPIFL